MSRRGVPERGVGLPAGVPGADLRREGVDPAMFRHTIREIAG